MDSILQNPLVVILAVGIATYFFLPGLLGPKMDPREPPVARTTIPYIGHVIGLMRRKFNYFVDLSRKTHLPIITVTVPGTKMYIVNAVELVQSIQKQPKILAFPPIQAKFSNKICGVSDETQKIAMYNVNGDEGDFGLLMDSHSAIQEALAPGAGMDRMNREMIQNISGSLEGLVLPGNKSVNIKLSRWLRNIVTLASTNSVYGPQNPFKDQHIQASFWQFESQMMTILVGILPSIFARNGIAGRTRAADAFEEYFKAGGHEEGSVLVQKRYETGSKHRISVRDIALYEVSGALAVLVNTVPATFWTMFFIYSDANLLEEIRKEVGDLVQTSSDDTGNVVRSLDITTLKTSCPLLLSTYQEVLRHRSVGTSVREVTEDTLLDGKWLLKKDSMIQMPSRTIHMNTNIWGNDAADFNPRRFMKEKNVKRPNLTAFRAFGGGTTLCPGRHFATNEVLAVVSMFVMRFNVKPVAGEWSLPTTDNTNAAAILMEPDTDIDVVVSVREGCENDKWNFGLRSSDTIFAVVDEDRTD